MERKLSRRAFLHSMAGMGAASIFIAACAPAAPGGRSSAEGKEDDMIEINEGLAHRLHSEKMAWLTTVRTDGTPLPTPIWFLWTGTGFLIFSQPDALKVRNIRRHPQVAVNFNTDATGEIFAVFTGAAEIDPNPVSPEERAAYVDKYRTGMQMIGVTPEEHAQTWSAVIRFTPTRVRAQLDEPQGPL